MREYTYCPITKERCVNTDKGKPVCMFTNDEGECIVLEGIESIIRLGTTFCEIDPCTMDEAVSMIASIGVTKNQEVLIYDNSNY